MEPTARSSQRNVTQDAQSAGDSLTHWSDNRIVEEIRRGRRAAFGELVHRYEKKLLRTIYRMVGNVQTAEDLTQDAFIKAYDRLESFDSAKRFGPWLFQIGVNGAIDWLRRQRRQRWLSLTDRLTGDGQIDIHDADPREQADLNAEVQHVLAQIPIKYRTVLTLRDIEGFPCSEVAAIIGRQEPTVRWRLLRAREMFRELWERRQGEKA